LVTGRFAFELRWWVVLRIFAGYVVLHANIVYRNIKNRTVCFQERFRLLSLATVLRNQFYFLLSQDCAACNIQVVKIRQSMLRTAEPKDNREFHNVNWQILWCGS